MVDWAIAELGAQTQEQREDIAEKVCSGLMQSVGGTNLVNTLICSCYRCRSVLPGWSQRALDADDKATAALALGSYDILQKLFPDLDTHDARGTSWCRFRPLDIAFERKDKVLVGEFLRYLKQLAPAGDELEKTLATKRHDLSGAVIDAIAFEYREGLQDILNFHEAYLPQPHKNKFEHWIRRSVVGASGCPPGPKDDYLTPLLDFAPKGNMVSRQTLISMCDIGSVHNIGNVLAHLGKDVDAGTIITLPIFIAVRSESALAVPAVLKAGANANITAKSNIPSLKKDLVSPLDVAVHKHNVSDVGMLLTFGATPLPDFADWPTHAGTYNFLRDHVMWETKKQVPTLKQFKWMDRAEREAFTF